MFKSVVVEYPNESVEYRYEVDIHKPKCYREGLEWKFNTKLIEVKITKKDKK